MHASITRQSFVQRHKYVLLSSCFGLILMMACGVTVTSISQASAQSLSISISIEDQYSTIARPTVELWLYVSKDGKNVALAGKLSMACDGVVFAHQTNTLASIIALPRQPAGGVYHCLYTDENGKTTPLTIPIPAGEVAITSPASGASILLPPAPTTPLPITPTPTPSGSPTPTPTPYHPPTPTPGAWVRLSSVTVRYILPTLPPGASAQAKIDAICGGSDDTAPCGTVYGVNGPATGAYVLIDDNSPTAAEFDTFPTGAAGKLQLESMLAWSPLAGGFQAVRVQYTDVVSISVIWSRA